MRKILPLLVLSSILLTGAGCSKTPSVSRNRPPANNQATNTTTDADLTKLIAGSGTPAHAITISNTSPTDATMHPLMLGVISGPDSIGSYDSTAMTKAYQDAGVTSVRNNDYYDDRLDLEGIFNCGGTSYPSWEGCDATNDKFYDWTKSDAQYQAYIDAGFVPLLRIGGEWENQNNNHDTKGPQNSIQEANWIIAANKMVDRYENWPAKPNAFTYLDIWTEAPGEHFWDRSNDDFIKFWVKAYKDIKNKHPELKIGGPGFSALVSVKVAAGQPGIAVQLLREMYTQRIAPDWLGWHMFGTDPTVFTPQAVAWQALLDGTGAYADQPWAGTGFFAKTEVMVDAYGNGGGNASEASTATAPPSTGKGAAVLTADWIALQMADIQGAYVYRGDDNQGKKSTTESDGIFTGDVELKPAAQAFRLWSQMTFNYPTLLTTNIPADGSTSIWALAAKNSDGDTAVLLSNPSAQATTVSINSNGIDISTMSIKSAWLVNDSNDGGVLIPITTSTIALPAESVILIEFAP